MSGSRLSISTERPEQRDVIRSLAISFVCPNKFKASRRIQSSAILVGASAVLGHPSKSDKFAEATEAENEAIDLYHFTRAINRALDEDGRRRVVEMMWEIAYADGRVDDFESNLIWRVADLLGISSRERVECGQRVASRLGIAP